MRDLGSTTSHREIVAYLRSMLDVFFVFSTEIVGDRLYVRSKDCAIEDRTGIKDRAVPLELTICRHTLALARPLVIDDTHAHPLVKGSHALDALGVAAYLGVPVFSGGQQLPRTLCALHVRPRRWLDEEIRMMVDAGAHSASMPF
ncbi:hypothetical protein OCH239_14655 [Roseivivax halodurans JCM 10272]|uniref:GAF domain-containing protein n=1 Tax=Roseivivax halodurans JCM 10272 TaxID=1449350 RepID=X7EIE1_9RHOB|nr:GAF domain-containing protein [Roseivivax halodurans]ETX15702.1 hypothetical protein OCH239_14655 [Roseivivax halodurans JCM 10272]